jgi:hypothetical protein
MARSTWHAYYFDSLDRTSPVARTAIIEADNEDDAGKIAIAQMGRCMNRARKDDGRLTLA